jgi:hypothetical protein
LRQLELRLYEYVVAYNHDTQQTSALRIVPIGDFMVNAQVLKGGLTTGPYFGAGFTVMLVFVCATVSWGMYVRVNAAMLHAFSVAPQSPMHGAHADRVYRGGRVAMHGRGDHNRTGVRRWLACQLDDDGRAISDSCCGYVGERGVTRSQQLGYA